MPKRRKQFGDSAVPHSALASEAADAADRFAAATNALVAKGDCYGAMRSYENMLVAVGEYTAHVQAGGKARPRVASRPAYPARFQTVCIRTRPDSNFSARRRKKARRK